jgi:hypothetical protein
MYRLVYAVPLITGLIVGCSKNNASDFTPARRPIDDRTRAIQESANQPDLLLALDPGNGEKVDAGKKSKEEKNLPAGWYGDYAQALAKAKMTGQPLLVLFH